MFRPFGYSSFLFGLACFIVVCSSAFAQSRKTATRAAEFDAFGGLAYVNNDYSSPHTGIGGTLGADYTQFLPRLRGLVIPSLQIRGTLTQGTNVNERSIAAGLKLASTWRNLHPYGDFMVGGGTITFNHPVLQPNQIPYTSDGSALYIFGGGLTIDTQSNFSGLIDYQRQSWDLGGTPPVRFYPKALTVGVVYHIPFGTHRSH